MDFHPLLIQFGGSFVAILVLAGLVAVMKLGGRPSFKNEAAVALAAREVEYGFDVARSSITRKGNAALARDADGRIMLIKRHGNKFAGRILTSSAQAQEDVDGLAVHTGERRFGSVRLSLSDASYWADAINRL